ncbi:MAG TPA: MFS transporter [Dehalococcoidia bacterium]|nr:MFS transporter [Dehalococcoidia bacterium]
MARHERQVVVYTNLGHALVHAIETAYGALLLDIALDLGSSEAFLGGVATVFGWAFGSTAFPAGLLSDRIGPQRVLGLTFAGAWVAALLVSLAFSPWLLALSMGLLGLAMGMYHPAATALIAQGVGERGMAMGMHGAAGNVGLALAPGIAGGIAALAGWRWAYVLMAGLAALLALWATRLPRDRPQGAAVGAGGRPRGAGESRATRVVAALLLVYVLSVLVGIVYRGTLTFLPSHIRLEVREDLGDWLTTGAYLTGAVGQYAGGLLTRRLQVEALAIGVTVAALLPLALMGLLSGAPLLAAAAAFVFFSFARQPIYNTLIADYTPARLVGSSFGLYFLAEFGLGGVGGVMAGAVVDRWDTSAAFLAMAGVWCLAAVASLALPLVGRPLRAGMRPAPV